MTATTKEMIQALTTIVKGLTEQKVAPKSIKTILADTRTAIAGTGDDHSKLLGTLDNFDKSITSYTKKGSGSQLITLAGKPNDTLRNRSIPLIHHKSPNQKMLAAFDDVIAKTERKRLHEAAGQQLKEQLRNSLFFTKTEISNGDFVYKSVTHLTGIPLNDSFTELQMCPNTEKNQRLLLSQHTRPNDARAVPFRESTIPLIAKILLARARPGTTVGAARKDSEKGATITLPGHIRTS